MTITTRNRTIVRATIAAVAAVGGGWWFVHRPSGAQAAPPAAVASALVVTAPLRQVSMSDLLTAFGEVTTGQVEAVSVPRAGQVSRLLVVPGQTVSQGTPLATLTSDPNARLAYTQAQSAVAFAQGELRRNEELFALQLATQSQVDAARKTLADAEGTLATQFQLGGAVGMATVTAPFDGVVTTVPVAQGDRIQPGAVIVEIGPTNVLRVRLGIEPDDSHLIRVGMIVTLAPIDDSTKTISAPITERQGVVDPKTQLVDAMALITGATRLVPGMHVRATIRVGQHLSWTAPRAAVLTDAGGAYLFQVSGGKAHRVNVTQGAEAAGLVAIAGPIDPRLPIVVVGNYVLQDGMPVREGAS
jgi:RND family efflux transporter MFP subunit